MSLTSKQIDELRSYAKDRKGELAKLINDAADTIEILSAKLHASQMERSSQYYHGGWIPCDERLPEEKDSIFAKYYGTDRWENSMMRKRSDRVIVTVEYPDGKRATDVASTSDGRWVNSISVVKRKVIAWMSLPEPYREEGD